MSKKSKIKYSDIPIVNKENLYVDKTTNKKISKTLIAFIIVFIVILLLLSSYSMAKVLEDFIINAKAEIAEPILIVENNPSIDITAVNNYGEYIFKVKNYNEQNKLTQTDLRYYIEILSNVDESVNIELYQGDNKIELINNKTDFIQISKDKKEEKEYKIKITYDRNKSNNINDILEKIQVKVHSEQVKA